MGDKQPIKIMKITKITAGMYRFNYKGLEGQIIKYHLHWYYLLNFKDSILYDKMEDVKIAVVDHIDNVLIFKDK